MRLGERKFRSTFTGNDLLEGKLSHLETLTKYTVHGLFLAEPGKEIEIATSKLSTMCLKY